MLASNLLAGVKQFKTAFSSRNIGIVAPVLQKASDPIQQLFLDKIKEYKQKSAGGKFVDATPEIQNELKSELDKVLKMYGGSPGEDMTQFPSFKWSEPVVDDQVSSPKA